MCGIDMELFRRMVYQDDNCKTAEVWNKAKSFRRNISHQQQLSYDYQVQRLAVWQMSITQVLIIMLNLVFLNIVLHII